MMSKPIKIETRSECYLWQDEVNPATSIDGDKTG